MGKVPRLNPINKELYNKNPKTFAENIDRFIQHGMIPAGTNPALKMIDYGDSRSLSQQEIAHLEAYILYLNGVNRAQIEVTTLTPRQFFINTMGVFLVLGIILITISFYVKKKKKE